jgi:diguanylate cyclase (GGDEF)-like protein|tara:strand:+ start:15424 stop:16182 length:759 start_codon:yes stop_codon:yes gene_type:complete
MKYSKVINTPNFALTLWATVFFTVLTTAFAQLYSVYSSPIHHSHRGSITIAIGIVVITVFLFVLFFGIRPFLNKLVLEKKQLQTHADTDPLTQLYNRRAFLLAFERELNFQRRGASGIATLVLMDLDDFKMVNDTFGHDVGDDVLRGVAKTLRNNIRLTDVIARFGGEEFIVLLPNTDLDAASLLCSKIRDYLKEDSANYAPQSALSITTVSMGIIALSYKLSFNEHLTQVDKALYKAKHGGKDCIETVIGN